MTGDSLTEIYTNIQDLRSVRGKDINMVKMSNVFTGVLNVGT